LLELARLAAAERAEPRQRAELASLDLDRGRAAEALARLAGLPAEGRVPCLRGEALAALDRCGEALPALAACPERASALRFARPRLACLLAARELDAAAAQLAAMPPALRDDASLRRLRRDLEREQRRAEEVKPAAAPSSPPAVPTPESRSPGPDAGPSAPVPAADPPRAAQPVAPEPAAPATATAAPAARATPEERTRLDALASQLASARRAGELGPVLAEAKALADRRPELLEAQRLAGEIAYRASRWPDAATYLGRARLDPAARPELLFYLAVARFESGDREGARTALEAAGSRLAPSPFVDRYRQKILAP
ncbi:MAG: hypothetical protein KJ058_12950, partial [Thermoanaerobaculia bacterium]|nr:hypothetical protein [Thermoanaerobaculia bacterium]